jgi:hypothetical protein
LQDDYEQTRAASFCVWKGKNNRWQQRRAADECETSKFIDGKSAPKTLTSIRQLGRLSILIHLEYISNKLERKTLRFARSLDPFPSGESF